MKLKRLIILTLVLSTLGTVTVFADTIGQKIRVVINNEETDDPGYLVDGKTMVPLRNLSDVMQAIITWDESSKKVTIFKPNVHMFLFDKDITMSFSDVLKGEREFRIVSQADNMLADVYAFKVAMTDPYGKSIDIVSENVFTEQKDSFSFKSKVINYDFKTIGKYRVRFMMKLEKGDDYQVVGEKVITSRTK